ncbi:7121_t:CDS:2 [Ambispora gerdemannii]|uniref:7121_t:CDS:1 n=1 Tax=Ambispora gerdemannii TaxID=144530 RepID=A0A9N9HEI3_9GLOM|nr:7121_t:CDS:2 [Ambispora gerdemannii]
MSTMSAHYDVLREEITGADFLDMTEKKFMQDRLARGPTTRFAKQVSDLAMGTFRSFSGKSDWRYNNMSVIVYSPVHCFSHHEIDENSPAFKLCIDDIHRRLENMGLVVDNT